MASNQPPLPNVGDGDEYELRARPDMYDPIRHERVVAWRTLVFMELGFGALEAAALAVRRDIDRARVERMTRAGCPPPLAAQIVL